MKKLIALFVLGLAGLFLLIQLVPYGRNHQNPPVVQDFPWPNQEARAIAQRACYDCHSNETTWPWYTNIAPFSWLVQRDVDEGRNRLNFSVWGRGEQEVDEIGETVRKGDMPPLQYTLIHPAARLSEAEVGTLLGGLAGTGGQPEGTEKEGGGD